MRYGSILLNLTALSPMIRFLLILLLLPLAAGAGPVADELFSQGEEFLANDRQLLAAKRYRQVLEQEPTHHLAQLRLRQVFLMQRAYGIYTYERALIEGDLFRNGSHFRKSGLMEPPEPGMSPGEVNRIVDAWSKYREARVVILQSGR